MIKNTDHYIVLVASAYRDRRDRLTLALIKESLDGTLYLFARSSKKFEFHNDILYIYKFILSTIINTRLSAQQNYKKNLTQPSSISSI